MNSVIVRNVRIGDGIPKICLPVVGKTEEEILAEAESLLDLPMDMVEWRVDLFQHVFELEKVKVVLVRLRTILGETPILFTVRTKKEGGELEISKEVYKELNELAIESGCVDLVDVENSGEKEDVETLIEKAHQADVLVIASYHNFETTPTSGEMIETLREMQKRGADVLKVAVMPHSKQDLLTLLAATDMMTKKYAKKPVATMAMDNVGVLSRVTGEIFGSAITFGCASKASAPGQIPAKKLKETLEMIHHLVENQ